MITESTMALEGGDVAMRTIGRPDSEYTLLFLHGWQDNCATFETTMNALFELSDNHYCVSFDWAGHGLSTFRGANNFYHFVDYVDLLHQIIARLPSRKVVIIGHSLGALVASCYCAAFPDKVTALLMIEGLGPLSEPSTTASKRLRDGVLSRSRVRLKPSRALKNREEALFLRSQVNHLPETLLQPIVDRGTYFDGETLRWSHDPKLKCDSLYRMSEAHALDIVSHIECPVLAILGEKGYSRLKSMQTRINHFKNISVETMPGGHHCHLENPKLTAMRIIEYANSVN
jgi:pimeloyl-ACP methyl ester carboxylesterase